MSIPIEKTLALIVTDAGRDAAVSAVAGGLALKLTHLAAGNGTVAPTVENKALGAKKIRTKIVSWAKPAPATIAVSTIIISSEPAWLLTEIGVYADDVLVAVGYRPSGLIEVFNGAPYALSGTLVLVGLPDDVDITVDAELTLDLAFIDPIASLFRLATRLTRANLDQELRLRVLEGKPTGGPRRLG